MDLHTQKGTLFVQFRLKQSGITNLMYIIEEYKKEQRLAIPYSSLMQASINTLIQDGFSVKYTKNHKDSMFYLSSLTKILIKVFKVCHFFFDTLELLVPYIRSKLFLF